MNLYLSTIIWESILRKGMSQGDLIDIAAEFGFKGIEFRPFWIDALAEIPIIATKLKKRELEATYACNDSLLSNTVENTLDSVKGIENSLLIAKKLNAKLLRINLATSDFDKDFISEQWWYNAVSHVLKQASALDIALAVENAPDNLRGDPTLIKKMLMVFDSPWLKLTFDTGNWLYTTYSPNQAFELLKEYIGYVHIKDILYENGLLKHTIPGSGVIDLADLINRLLQVFTGIYTLEFPGADDPLSRIKQSLSFLKHSNFDLLK